MISIWYSYLAEGKVVYGFISSSVVKLCSLAIISRMVVGWFPFSQFVGHATPNFMNSHILFLIRQPLINAPPLTPLVHLWHASVFWFSFPCLNFQWIWKCKNSQTGARCVMRISKREMRVPNYWLIAFWYVELQNDRVFWDCRRWWRIYIHRLFCGQEELTSSSLCIWAHLLNNESLGLAHSWLWTKSSSRAPV